MTLSLPDLLAVVEAAAKWAVLQELAADHGHVCLKCLTGTMEFEDRVKAIVAEVEKRINELQARPACPVR